MSQLYLHPRARAGMLRIFVIFMAQMCHQFDKAMVPIHKETKIFLYTMN